MSEPQIAFGEADITNCDREQIHIPGSIQPHGAMLVLEPVSLRVVQAAGDCRALLGADIPDLLGGVIDGLLSAADCQKIRRLSESERQKSRPLHLSFSNSAADRIDLVVHVSGGFILLELESQREEDPADALTLVQEMIQRVQNADSVAKSYGAIVNAIRDASGFDRVMLYRFLEDGTGSVEAEARGTGVASYLGLRYPASDIPLQARALYLRNVIRVIPDARYKPSRLVASAQWPAGQTLDLSDSALRSVSPIHLEYLANMGVIASMSLSLIIDGKLWGLIACHHGTPKFPTHQRRVAFELFSQMASFQLETRLEAEDLGLRLRQKTIGEALIADLSGAVELADGLRRFQPKLFDYVQASGVGLWVDGHFSGFGKTPPGDEVALLVSWLNGNATEGVFGTDRLSTHYPPAARYADKASGILALSISRTPRDYVIWFRPEVAQTVSWAGNPDKPVEKSPDGFRLNPRKSFAAWTEQVYGRSEPWSTLDLRTAQALRVSLLEIVLQHTDQLSRQRESARIQQQALLVELDNRIAQWELVAQELKQESDRRALVEAELSQVLRRTVLEQEAERQRIARELHDSLGQYLTVMRLDLEGIGRDTAASDSIRQRVEKLKNLTTDVGQEVNQLAWEIRPTVLDDLGLQKALQQFLEEWAERSSLKFDVHLNLNDRRLPPAIETALYRVLQEAIRNVIKHAQASKVGVILDATPDEVRLIIEDDGKGFVWDVPEKDAAASPRLGLLGVRERLALVDGLLEVETSPGSGTTLLIHVPL